MNFALNPYFYGYYESIGDVKDQNWHSKKFGDYWQRTDTTINSSFDIIQANCLLSQPEETIDKTSTPPTSLYNQMVIRTLNSVLVPFPTWNCIRITDTEKKLFTDELNSKVANCLAYIVNMNTEAVLATTSHDFKWFNFSQSLFPSQREHTLEERKAYSNFIESFFEEIDI